MPAPAATPLAGIAHSGVSAHGFGLRATVMVVAALITVILMFQAWFDFPAIARVLDSAVSDSSFGVESLMTGAVSTSASMPQMLGVANTIRGMIDLLTQQVSSLSSMSDLAGFQSFTGAFGLAATVVTVLFVLWVVCLIGIVVGSGLKMFSGNDFILFVAFAATAVVSLLCIITGFVVNGAITGAMTDAFVLSGSSSTASLLFSMGSFVAPAAGVYLTLVVAAAGAVGSLLIKE